MLLTELPNELLTKIFITVKYEDLYNLGFVNKKMLQILKKLLKKEKKYKIEIRNLNNLKKYVKHGFRYINSRHITVS